MSFRLRSAIVFTAILMLVGTASAVHAQQATLAWDASPDASVTGYRVSVGTGSAAYTRTIDVGKVTQYTVTGLDVSLNYYFAVQAYTGTGLMSAFSNEATLPAPVPPGTTVMT